MFLHKDLYVRYHDWAVGCVRFSWSSSFYMKAHTSFASFHFCTFVYQGEPSYEIFSLYIFLYSASLFSCIRSIEQPWHHRVKILICCPSNVAENSILRLLRLHYLLADHKAKEKPWALSNPRILCFPRSPLGTGKESNCIWMKQFYYYFLFSLKLKSII